MFEPLTRVLQLDLSSQPRRWRASCRRRMPGRTWSCARVRAATLGGPGTGGGPWGMNVEYAWVEVDGGGQPGGGGSSARRACPAANVREPASSPPPALAAERVLRYRLAVQGLGHGGTDCLHRDRHGHGHGAGRADGDGGGADVGAAGGRRPTGEGETIEVSVTFSTPVTVTGPPAMTPTIGLEVGTVVRRGGVCAQCRRRRCWCSATRWRKRTRDEDGIAVPAERHPACGRDHCRRARAGAAALGHDAVAAHAAHHGQRHRRRSADRRGVRAHAAGARGAGGGGARKQSGGGELLEAGRRRRDRHRRARRDHRRLLAAEQPGHRGAEARGFRRSERSDRSSPCREQRAERAAGGGVRRAGRGEDVLDTEQQRPRRGKPRGRGVRAADARVAARPEQPTPALASFVPKADAGEDLVLRAGESATLGGPGTGGGPWG